MNADRVTITDLQAWRDRQMIDALIRNNWSWPKARADIEKQNGDEHG